MTPLLFLRLRNLALRTMLTLLLSPRRSHVRLEKLGSSDGAWIVPSALLGPDSICYCVGVGEDTSFDLALIERLGCDVYAFDPTPRARRHVQATIGKHLKYHFMNIGLWHRNEPVRFYAPRDPPRVSYSAVNLQQTNEYFEAECRTLGSIMQDWGHKSLDLLKLDIEGAEHLVIESILADDIAIRTLCVEFDQPMPLARLFATLKELRSAGYRLVCIDRWNYTFVRETQPLSTGDTNQHHDRRS